MARLLEKFKETNWFERILLLLGLFIIVIGFNMINALFQADTRLTWSLIQAIFLWLILIFMIIVVDSNESVKKDLKAVIQEQVVETKLMQNIARAEVEELKLLKKKRK